MVIGVLIRQDLSNPLVPPKSDGQIVVSSVNIEENGQRQPVNYVLPPGISRMFDSSQPQLLQQNEQALSMKITDLSPADARAVYKSTAYDLRRYKRLQMFAHAERRLMRARLCRMVISLYLFV